MPLTKRLPTSMPQIFESKLVPPLEALLSGYRREDLIGDLIAGLVVAIVLIPQAMAYALRSYCSYWFADPVEDEPLQRDMP